MAMTTDSRRRAAARKIRTELDALCERGVIVEGNAPSPVLFVKGAPGKAEQEGKRLFSGADGKALQASLLALGYAPEDWLGMAGWQDDGSPMAPDVVRLAITVLDPTTLVACDETAASLLREAYANDLVALEDLSAALLTPGIVVSVAGMRVLALGGFEEALASPQQKQVMWARLKLIPPLGEPY